MTINSKVSFKIAVGHVPAGHVFSSIAKSLTEYVLQHYFKQKMCRQCACLGELYPSSILPQVFRFFSKPGGIQVCRKSFPEYK